MVYLGFVVMMWVFCCGFVLYADFVCFVLCGLIRVCGVRFDCCG